MTFGAVDGRIQRQASSYFFRAFWLLKGLLLHPRTSEVYGRVQLQKGPLGNALYPLYYKTFVQTSFVPGTVRAHADHLLQCYLMCLHSTCELRAALLNTYKGQALLQCGPFNLRPV